jgi:hypothetical protein
MEDTIRQFEKKLDSTMTRLELTTATASLRGAIGGACVVYGTVSLGGAIRYSTTEIPDYFNPTVLVKPLGGNIQLNKVIEGQFAENAA